MRLSQFLVVILCFASAGARADDQVLTFTGLGPVRIGMTVVEAEAALGAKLKAFDPTDGLSRTVCWLTERADGRAAWITYMVQNGKIVRIDVWKNGPGAPPVRTEAGITIGATEQTILEKYGTALKPEGHKSLGLSGYYATVYSSDGKYGLLFETAYGSLVSMRSGLPEAIELSETCL